MVRVGGQPSQTASTTTRQQNDSRNVADERRSCGGNKSRGDGSLQLPTTATKGEEVVAKLHHPPGHDDRKSSSGGDGAAGLSEHQRRVLALRVQQLESRLQQCDETVQSFESEKTLLAAKRSLHVMNKTMWSRGLHPTETILKQSDPVCRQLLQDAASRHRIAEEALSGNKLTAHRGVSVFGGGVPGALPFTSAPRGTTPTQFRSQTAMSWAHGDRTTNQSPLQLMSAMDCTTASRQYRTAAAAAAAAANMSGSHLQRSSTPFATSLPHTEGEAMPRRQLQRVKLSNPAVWFAKEVSGTLSSYNKGIVFAAGPKDASVFLRKSTVPLPRAVSTPLKSEECADPLQAKDEN